MIVKHLKQDHPLVKQSTLGCFNWWQWTACLLSPSKISLCLRFCFLKCSVLLLALGDSSYHLAGILPAWANVKLASNDQFLSFQAALILSGLWRDCFNKLGSILIARHFKSLLLVGPQLVLEFSHVCCVLICVFIQNAHDFLQTSKVSLSLVYVCVCVYFPILSLLL